MFAVCGFWRVEVRGRQAAPQAAPILCVAPHSTFFDALAVAVMGAPSVVAKAETKHVPFFGSLIAYTQPLLVHRTDPDSRRKTLDTMKERSAEGGGWQQVLIFPEGTCTNRTALITFRLGAFIPGVPVQPVILRCLFLVVIVPLQVRERGGHCDVDLGGDPRLAGDPAQPLPVPLLLPPLLLPLLLLR